MVIFGIDYDGTIADTNRMKSQWIEEKLGLKFPPWKCSRTLCVPIIGLDNYEEMSNVVYEREWSLKAPPVKGALKGLKEIEKLGEVYVITVRPEHRIQWAREWLEQHKVLSFIKEFVSASKQSKGKICRQYSIDVLLDDDERHLMGIEDKDLLRVLIKDGGPSEWSELADIKYVNNWKSFTALIMSLFEK